MICDLIFLYGFAFFFFQCHRFIEKPSEGLQVIKTSTIYKKKGRPKPPCICRGREGVRRCPSNHLVGKPEERAMAPEKTQVPGRESM